MPGRDHETLRGAFGRTLNARHVGMSGKRAPGRIQESRQERGKSRTQGMSDRRDIRIAPGAPFERPRPGCRGLGHDRAQPVLPAFVRRRDEMGGSLGDALEERSFPLAELAGAEPGVGAARLGGERPHDFLEHRTPQVPHRSITGGVDRGPSRPAFVEDHLDVAEAVRRAHDIEEARLALRSARSPRSARTGWTSSSLSDEQALQLVLDSAVLPPERDQCASRHGELGVDGERRLELREGA